MQAASTALGTAIEALVRQPQIRISADWDRDGDTSDPLEDLSGLTTSVTVKRSITTDLPAEANLVTGGGAAQLDVRLGGVTPDGRSVPQVFQGYSGAIPTDPLGAPVTAEIGMLTDSGSELLAAFTGRVRSIDVDQQGASLNALDGSELMRAAVTLPVFAATSPGVDKPGLTAGYVLNEALRLNGYESQPPARSSVAFHAPLHGTARPAVGTLEGVYGPGLAYAANSLPSFAGVGSGEGLLVADGMGRGSTVRFLTLSGTTPATVGGVAFLELFEVAVDSTGMSDTGDALVAIWGDAPAAAAGYVQLVVRRDGSVGFRGSKDGSTVNAGFSAAGVAPVDGTPFYAAMHVTNTAGGWTVRIRVNGTTVPLTVTATGGAALTGTYAVALLYTSTGEHRVAVRGVQFTTEPYSATMWNDGFAPSAVLDATASQLQVVPAVDGAAPWPLMQEIAAADCGVLFVDEGGVVRYLNRRTLGTSESVAVISSSRALMDLSSSRAIDTVRNSVNVPAAGFDIDTDLTLIWAASEVLRIPPGGVLQVSAETDGPILAFDTAFSYYSVGTEPDPYGSGYRAAQNADGTGGDVSNLVISVGVYPQRVTLLISNPNGFDVYLVENSLAASTRGQPMLQIAGRLARPRQTEYRARADDATSIATYGQQVLDVPATQWRQSDISAQALADDLLARLAEPHPVISDIPVVADPRLQLGDRVTVIDRERLLMARDCVIVGIEVTASTTGGLEQRLTLRDAGSASTGLDDTMTWGVGTWGALTAWA